MARFLTVPGQKGRWAKARANAQRFLSDPDRRHRVTDMLVRTLDAQHEGRTLTAEELRQPGWAPTVSDGE